MKKKVVIAGGTGFLGSNLAEYLTNENFEVVVLGRKPPIRKGNWSYTSWNAHSLDDWANELEGAHAIVNLTGRSVDCIKNPENCDSILRSRIDSVKVLNQALTQCQHKPSVWVQMSTAHIYGDSCERFCEEDSSLGYGLAPYVGKAWEQEFNKVQAAGLRKVILRTSFVLVKHGGALPKLALLSRCRLGGTIGKGNQGMSWIHEDDMNQVFYNAISDEKVKGVYIASSPYPLANKEFMKILRKALNVKIGLHAFESLVKIAAPFFMKSDPDLALYGRYCIPRKLINDGFQFKYPTLAGALESIYKS